jgi:oligoribonuclease
MNDAPFVWVDIETNGLDAHEERFEPRILEIGLLVTNADLVMGDNICTLVGPAPTDEEVSKWDPIVQKMHTESGLIEDLRSAQRRFLLPDTDTVSMTLANWLRERFPEPVKPMIAGASIRLDRAFGERLMPALFTKFHYRQADVSALKEFCQRWLPGCSDEDIKNGSIGKRDIHRPIPDIIDSIGLAGFLRGRMMRGAYGSQDLSEFNISDPD